jgi:hypothetical protein
MVGNSRAKRGQTLFWGFDSSTLRFAAVSQLVEEAVLETVNVRVLRATFGLQFSSAAWFNFCA